MRRVEVDKQAERTAHVRSMLVGEVAELTDGSYVGWVVMAIEEGIVFVNDGDLWPWDRLEKNTNYAVRILPKGTTITITL
jgi:hypothetical protein